jgi:hypothetical protein
MARPQVANGEDDLQMWRVAANIFNKQLQTADRGWPLSFPVWRGLTIKSTYYELFNKASELDGYFNTT